jgi:hypothetical protein
MAKAAKKPAKVGAKGSAKKTPPRSRAHVLYHKCVRDRNLARPVVLNLVAAAEVTYSSIPDQSFGARAALAVTIRSEPLARRAIRLRASRSNSRRAHRSVLQSPGRSLGV